VFSVKNVAVVRLYFLTGNEGGQERLITNNFSTPIIFEKDKDLKYGLWSAVIEFIKKPDHTRNGKAHLYLLVYENPEAPNHLLKIGMKFELISTKTIAKGEELEVKIE
jgi:hypothetical protein